MTEEEIKNSEEQHQEDEELNLEGGLAEIVTVRIARRAARAEGKLKAQLTGKILLNIVDSSKNFLFETVGDTITTTAVDNVAADCVIKVREADFFKILSGDLNPQIAMLSDRIKVQGKGSLAIYFFNLCVPRSGVR